jgi:hypothetical protein
MFQIKESQFSNIPENLLPTVLISKSLNATALPFLAYIF